MNKFTRFLFKDIHKGLLAALLLSLFANVADAQIYASCVHKDIYVYNEKTDDFDFNNGFDEKSMFKTNAESMLEHTHSDGKDSYFVKSSEFDEESQTLTMEVVDEEGDPYTFLWQLKDNFVKALFSIDGTVYMAMYTVKNFWTDEE